jgi:molecular chaperone DnaK
VTASNRLTEDEMKRIIQENEQYAVTEKNVEAFQQVKTDVDRYLREIEKLRPDVAKIIAASDFGEDALNKADRLVERAKRAIEMQDVQALKEVGEPLERTTTMFKGVAAKLK